MAIRKNAKTRIAQLTVNDISSMVLGTGTISELNLPAMTPDEATRDTPNTSVGTQSSNTILLVDSLTGNGTTFSEAGIYLNSDTILFDRVVFPDFNKTSSNDLTVTIIDNYL